MVEAVPQQSRRAVYSNYSLIRDENAADFLRAYYKSNVISDAARGDTMSSYIVVHGVGVSRITAY